MNNLTTKPLPSIDMSAASALPVWLYWVIGILIALVIVFFVILPLYRKIHRKRLKIKETSEIKKDLMIWHHLAQLVRGGTEHQKAKQALSGQIVMINNAFKQGMQMLSMHNRKMYELPWFALLGEPFSGKSTLLRNSELEMISSAEEEAVGEEEKKGVALRLWLGAKAVVCDINGKVFFDRWLNGSSAEWSYICKLLHRKRFKRPLDGIIITIPADALLADDEALSQQKAVLMTTEIGQLLHTVGMNLPCYVVITKTDMVNGFDEYVMGINEDLRTQIFGWINEDGAYQAGSFKTFWENLITRLRSGCEKSMLSKNVATKLSTLSNRMEVTGKIYMFPESFNGLYKNLSIYLRALFGEGNFHGADDIVLEGVFFTSARDSAITLSPSFAQLCGKKVEDAPIPHEQNPHYRPFFIRDMLNNQVFRRSENAFFTIREKIKRNVPKYFLCLSMLVIGTIWLSTAYFQRQELVNSLERRTEYYTALANLLDRGNVFSSVLIKKAEDGKYELDASPIANEKFSRLQFFFEQFADRETPNKAPFGFGTASWVVFGENDMGYAERAFIFNQMIGTMVRTPAIHAAGDKLLASGTDSELNEIKREAIDSFTVLNMVKEENYASVMMSGQFNLKVMLAYILPSISNDISNLLSSFLPKYDKKYTNTMDPLYIHSEDFIKAQEMGLKSIVEAWKQLKAYPESSYAKIRSAIRLSEKIKQRDASLHALLDQSSQIFDVSKLDSILAEWNKLIREQMKDIADMNAKVDDVRLSLPLHMGGNTEQSKKNPLADQSFLYRNLPVNLLLRYHSQLYEKKMRNDFDFVEERAGQFITSSWNPREIRKIVLNEEKKTVSALSNELKILHENISDLRDTSLYQWKLIEKQGASDYLYNILNKFYAEAAKAKFLSDKEIAQNDFKTNWLKTQQMINDSLEQYDAVVRPYAENDEITQAAAEIRKMFVFQAQAERYKVLHDGIERLPLDNGEMESFIAGYANQENIFDFSPELARETLGEVSVAAQYDPKTVKQMLENIFVIARSFLKNKKDQSAVFLNDSEHYEEKLKAFETYLGSFIEYWGTYPDHVYNELSSWADFRKRLGTMKAFKINSLLQSVYVQSLNVLKGMDDSSLTEELKKEKAKYITVLTDRIGLLTPLYSDAAQKMLNAWGDLPESAEEAWKRLVSLTDKELKNTLFSLKAQGKRGQISWWNDFIANGVALLKSENEKILRKELFPQENGKKQTSKKPSFGLLDNMSAFPLCRDCNTGRTLSPQQMRKLTGTLQSIVAQDSASAEEQAEKSEALIDKQLSLFPDQDSLDWAGIVFKTASALTDDKNPVIWTLYQAPIDSQTAMLSGNDVAAVNRFRYVEVKTDAAKIGKRFGTASAQETVIGQGRAATSVTLRFYKSSADREPEAQVRLGDYWSAFRIYLKNGGYIDPQTNRMYVPLTIKDKTGGKYVYVVGIKMNRSLPKPDEWPTKKNWQAAVASIKTASTEE
ncbi:MAG: hypothetical protein IKR09_01755 [Alphaproteobacteria bacterium]|nr:hypothetical protein [Alphaproteobacteria bacterium]